MDCLNFSLFHADLSLRNQMTQELDATLSELTLLQLYEELVLSQPTNLVYCLLRTKSEHILFEIKEIGDSSLIYIVIEQEYTPENKRENTHSI